MSDTTQSFQNHARVDPLYHRFVLPLLLVHLIWTLWMLYSQPGLASAEAVLLAITLSALALTARLAPLRAQDRLIRLEEQLRYQRILSPELAAKAATIPVPQIVALRFASDAELPVLIEQVIAGKLEKPKDIKAAVRIWRADLVRV